jgi:hypothetical protein
MIEKIWTPQVRMALIGLIAAILGAILEALTNVVSTTGGAVPTP